MRVRRAMEQKRQETDESKARISLFCTQLLQDKTHSLDVERERLLAYSPQRTLERGFALIEDEKGSVLSSAREVETGDIVTIRFADGTAQAEISGKESV